VRRTVLPRRHAFVQYQKRRPDAGVTFARRLGETMQKIRFWSTVGATYGFLFGNLRRFAILSCGWLAGFALTELIFVRVAGIFPILSSVIGILGVIVFEFLGNVAFAVAWHRAILLDEPPQPTLRFGRREWRFFGYSMLITLIVGGIDLAITLALGGATAGLVKMIGKVGGVFGVVPAVAWFVVLGFGARLMLALPAVAVDEPQRLIKLSWERGRGNGARIFWGIFISVVPFAIASVAFSFLFFLPPSNSRSLMHTWPRDPTLGWAIANWVFVFLYFVETAIAVGFLSFSYRQIVTGPPPVPEVAGTPVPA
jgi:hypothetical protein